MRVLVLLLCGLAVPAVLCYNAWSYGCGRCCLKDLLTLGPVGSVLLGLILVSAVVLMLLKLRNRRRLARQSCSCGSISAESWRFCPRCGAGRKC